MPQTFQVLRCYKCLIFQIHQVKKSNKWACKLCGEKQSVKRHYGVGTGKDCRIHVQKLNKMQAENVKTPNYESDSDSIDKEESSPEVDKIFCKANESKWANYINTTEEVTKTDEPMYLHDQEVVLEIPKKVKISQNSNKYQYKITSGFDETCSAALLKKSYEDDNALEINTTLTPRKSSSETKSQIWKPPFNSKKYYEYQNYFPEYYKEKLEEDSMDNNNPLFSSNIEEQKSNTIVKQRARDSSTQRIKTSKWDDFIEETQNTLNYISENDTSHAEFIDNSTSPHLHTVSSVQEYSLPVAHSSENTKTKIKQCMSLFSMSDDCDLDNILNC